MSEEQTRSNTPITAEESVEKYENFKRQALEFIAEYEAEKQK